MFTGIRPLDYELKVFVSVFKRAFSLLYICSLECIYQPCENPHCVHRRGIPTQPKTSFGMQRLRRACYLIPTTALQLTLRNFTTWCLCIVISPATAHSTPILWVMFSNQVLVLVFAKEPHRMPPTYAAKRLQAFRIVVILLGGVACTSPLV